MPRYTDDTRERVRAAVDMVDLVQTRTELRKAGPASYMGTCPFHDDRSPSFSVDADRKLYHCFGCQAGGDCFSFVQELESTDFTGAIEFLAGRYGVALEIVDDDPKAAARRKRHDLLLALTERAAAYYERSLWESDEGRGPREYLLGRGLTEEALRAYRVGFAPNAWDRLVSASTRSGVKERDLIDAGLAVRKRDGSGAVDRFRGRITFPLADGRGRVRGFGCRAMGDDHPKYLNTSENEIFHKGSQLFGLHLARSAAAAEGVAVLVEGYTDVIALHQVGVKHAVALMGTAMTAEQVAELARLAPQLVLALDPDGAGEAAMEKTAVLSRGSRLELKVAMLPDGRDPAELVQDGRVDELKAALADPMHFARFRVQRLLRGAGQGTAEQRDEVMAALAPVLAGLPDGALREELTAMVADRLQIGPAIVDRIVRGAPAAGTVAAQQSSGYQQRGGHRQQQHQHRQSAEQHRPVYRLDPHDDQERTLLGLMVALGERGREQLARLDLDDLGVPAVRAVAEWLRAGGDEGGQLPDDERLVPVARDVLLRSAQLKPTDAVLEVELAQLALRRIERQIHQARAAGQPADELLRSVSGARQRLDDAMSRAVEDGD